MDVKCINPFLDSVKSVLEQLGITDIKMSGLNKKEKMFVDLEITSMIGIVGDIRGNISYSMSEESAKKVISIMMMGMSIDKIDEVGRSAIGELTNMITGNASTLLYSNGYLTDITPPSTILGKDMYFIISTVETITIEIDTSIGRIEVNIGLEV
ncbi:chemotaxis protein CheX [Clostridium saccharobutylicum]|uniref:Inhibitor of MCP methylation n=1 Tax=Clostridium saccharobutylicum DSM 13864 TaxID=1345695 RepID=U5MR09_CLOSA|nr:chemotaxis protein CheX [Clostridium saccharobutylicum]AGX43030.1 inhibitor of MCP methylation [Clostridium saccharobutylicum DSM 13864]AQR90321.1 CheY-P phosphatase CheX [Clostridium saccharobutylicum]AQS00227.1 CheY-P phosphatase CheX [Clostridium saccharobutylicum]AQS14210.1 CheY-P phosphatase CheX [Clostridium saccharobutylicum]MBA2905357.1 chemotaxis protein CheX [Clostridium saccharobutylicum]